MTIGKWDSAAESYAEAQQKSGFVRRNEEFVRERFSRIKGLRVLDMGCGYGSFTRLFDEMGAEAVGCDGSEKMLQMAEKSVPNARFDIVDLNGPLPYDNESFDVVFCNQVLMDIEDIETAVAEAERVLKSGGTFWFSIVHPAFYDGVWQTEDGRKYAKAVSRYISHYSFENNFWGATAHFHRPISYYLNAAAQRGLKFMRMDEPRTYDGDKNDDIPLFLYAEFVKDQR